MPLTSRTIRGICRAETGTRSAFWASYWGCALGSIVPMALGALLGSAVSRAGHLRKPRRLRPGRLAYVAIPALTLSIAAASAISLYCAVLSTIAIVQTFAPAWQAGSTRTDMRCRSLLALVAVAMALFAGPNFMESYTNFLLLLLYVMVPWTAINLVDYYLIRHGDYDVASFLAADGGIYGNYNVPALLCYAIGILVQLPFVSNGLFSGPMVRVLGGADLSWIAGLIVVGPLYYAMMRGRRSAAR